MNYIVCDIETTGLNPNIHEIIEIGAIKVRDEEIVDRFSALIKPIQPISDFITNLTGITNEMVENQPNEAEVLREFLSFIGDSKVLIGHNIDSFDFPFINRRLEVNGLPNIRKQTIDTLTLARERISFQNISNHKLETVARYFHISGVQSHRALEDVITTWEIFKKLSTYQEEIERCPKCGRALRKVNGRYGPFISCSGYPTCRYSRNL